MVESGEHNESSDSASPRQEGGENASLVDSRLEIFQEIALALNSTLDPIRLLDVLNDKSILYTGATPGSVLLLEA